VNFKASVCSFAFASLVASPAAWADFSFNGTLTSPTLSITAPQTYAFNNSTPNANPAGTLVAGTSGVSSAATGGLAYNFLDSWFFSLGPNSDVSGFVGSVNVSNGGSTTQGVSNLQLRLTGPSPMSVIWTNAVIPTSAGSSLVFSTFPLSGAALAQGNYTLEVRGLLPGTANPIASYAGTLEAVTAVPLPNALPLLGAGLLMFPFLARRRLRND
jgi:hypothetical protein